MEERPALNRQVKGSNPLSAILGIWCNGSTGALDAFGGSSNLSVPATGYSQMDKAPRYERDTQGSSPCILILRQYL